MEDGNLLERVVRLETRVDGIESESEKQGHRISGVEKDINEIKITQTNMNNGINYIKDGLNELRSMVDEVNKRDQISIMKDVIRPLVIGAFSSGTVFVLLQFFK